MIYFITMIFAVAFIYPLKEYNNKKLTTSTHKYKKIYIFISFCIAFFPLAFRYGIGTDYSLIYYPYFLFIGQGTRYFDEIGFNILNKLVYILTGDFRVLIFITAFIFLFHIYKGILENSKDIVFSLIMLFIGQAYFYSMNMIRQSMALAIIFYAIKYLKEDNKFKYICCTLVASTLHISALLMLPMIFINKMKLKNNTKIAILLCLICLGPVVDVIVNKAIMSTKYAWYYNSQYSGEEVSTIVIILNILILILDFIYSKNNKVNKDYIILSNINFIGIVLLVIARSFPLFNRIIRYFSIFQILFIPEIIKLEEKRNMNLLLKMFIFNVFFITMYYQIFLLGGDEVVPYVSIFDV